MFRLKLLEGHAVVVRLDEPGKRMTAYNKEVTYLLTRQTKAQEVFQLRLVYLDLLVFITLRHLVLILTNFLSRLARQRFPTIYDDLAIYRVQLHHPALSLHLLTGYQCSSASSEYISY